MKHTPVRRIGHFATEHLTWLSLCGIVAVITGFTPEEWVAHLAEKLRLSGAVDGHWPQYLDTRAVLVAVGVGVIVTDVLLNRRAATRLLTAPVAGMPSPTPPPAAPMPDIIGPLTEKQASRMIERLCEKIDEFTSSTPKARARERLLAWLRGQLDETQTAIGELQRTINANQNQGGLGSAIANLGHATNLGDQKRLKRALEAAIQELEQGSDGTSLSKTAATLKQVVRMSGD